MFVLKAAVSPDCWACLEEILGGPSFQCSVIDNILIGEVLKGLDGHLLVVGVHGGVQVAKVAGQQQYSKQPPDGAD